MLRLWQSIRYIFFGRRISIWHKWCLTPKTLLTVRTVHSLNIQTMNRISVYFCPKITWFVLHKFWDVALWKKDQFSYIFFYDQPKKTADLGKYSSQMFQDRNPNLPWIDNQIYKLLIFFKREHSSSVLLVIVFLVLVLVL